MRRKGQRSGASHIKRKATGAPIGDRYWTRPLTVCPLCEGNKKIPDYQNEVSVKCPECQGKGKRPVEVEEQDALSAG